MKIDIIETSAIAQTLAFFLMVASICLLAMDRMTPCLFLYALSVGCRPFNALYAAPLFGVWFFINHRDGVPVRAMARALLPGIGLGLLVAFDLGLYNFIRFGNPLEFGHNYLPEFTREGNTQFSLSHWRHNLENIFRMPRMENGKLTFDMLGPTALQLTMPLFIICLLETIVRLIRRKLDWEDILLILSLMIHFNLLLLHRTMGGMQFGVRYMIDLMPALLLLTFRKKRRPHIPDALLMCLGVAMNVYGAVVFYIY